MLLEQIPVLVNIDQQKKVMNIFCILIIFRYARIVGSEWSKTYDYDRKLWAVIDSNMVAVKLILVAVKL